MRKLIRFARLTLLSIATAAAVALVSAEHPIRLLARSPDEREGIHTLTNV